MKNLLITTAISALALVSACNVGATTILDTAPITIEGFLSNPTEYSPSSMGDGTNPAQDEAPACTDVVAEGYGSGVADGEKLLADLGIASVTMTIEQFAGDPDVLAVTGPLPAQFMGYTLVFADPALNPDFVVIVLQMFDANGCYAGYLEWPAYLVLAGLDGK